jgi:hypothetical protein
MLKDKIKFLEDFSLDRRLYWRISDIYGRYEWEIIWHKNNLATPWQAKKVGSKNWLPMNAKRLTEELKKRSVDIEEFERQLTGNLLTHVVFCNSAITEAKKLLGEDKVEAAISQHESFAQELLNVIRELGDKEEVEKAEKVNETKSAPKKIPTLELNPDRRKSPRGSNDRPKGTTTLLRLIKNSK